MMKERWMDRQRDTQVKKKRENHKAAWQPREELQASETTPSFGHRCHFISNTGHQALKSVLTFLGTLILQDCLDEKSLFAYTAIGLMGREVRLRLVDREVSGKGSAYV